MRFSTIFLLKWFGLGPIWPGKNDSANFFVFAKIFVKNGKLFYFGKSNKKSNKNVIWYFRKLGVRVVNNYADTSMTTKTLFENFEGFSQILKEQWGKKGIWVCLHIQ